MFAKSQKVITNTNIIPHFHKYHCIQNGNKNLQVIFLPMLCSLCFFWRSHIWKPMDPSSTWSPAAVVMLACCHLSLQIKPLHAPSVALWLLSTATCSGDIANRHNQNYLLSSTPILVTLTFFVDEGLLFSFACVTQFLFILLHSSIKIKASCDLKLWLPDSKPAQLFKSTYTCARVNEWAQST